ncbi:nascent polypeptide-associated complex subunit alpha, muscle-specific form-like [Pogoniulus pusillus]|uniref:nascent polypeptide-associated complex subunit alpha, muscle-specific form-like n=1 Tax=Pogoniulus pusillus TaxID=488313 RepID=UPI0030B93CB7
MQLAGGLSAPSPPQTPVASGSFTPSPTPPPYSSSSSSSSRCYGDSVPAPWRALRRSCTLSSPGGKEVLCPAEGASGDGAVRRGLSSPATPGSASVTARPPSWFHLSLEPRGLPASGSTGRPPVFKGPAAPSPQRGYVAFAGGYVAFTGGYAHLGSEPPSRISLATPQTALHRTQHHLRAVPFQVAFGSAQEGHAWGLSRTVIAAQEGRHEWQWQCLLASPPVTLGDRSRRDQRMLAGRGGEP